VKRDPESRKRLDSCFRRNDDNKNFHERPNNEWFSVLILTDCDQAPLRGQQS
jgi:hypothetical protein